MASNNDKYVPGDGNRRKGDKKKRVRLPQLEPRAAPEIEYLAVVQDACIIIIILHIIA